MTTEHKLLLELTKASKRVLSLARPEGCACGHHGCTETKEAWESLELATNASLDLVEDELYADDTE